MIRTILLLITIGILASCSKKTLQVGSYTTVKEGMASFAGTDMEVYDQHRIKIHYWSDTGGRIGEGSYRIKNNKLYIDFDSVQTASTTYRTEAIRSAYGDAYTYILKGDSSLFSSIVSVLNTKEEVITSGILGENGELKIHVNRSEKPVQIFIQSFGYESLNIPLKDPSSKRFHISMKNTFDTPFEQSQKVFKIKRKGTSIILTEGSRVMELHPNN